MSEAPRATVREIDGQLVLDDPDALAVTRAIGKINCKNTVDACADRVAHFRRRVVALSLPPSSVVIVLLNVDDPHGGALADVLMPGHDWQVYRDRERRRMHAASRSATAFRRESMCSTAKRRRSCVRSRARRSS